MDQDGLIYNSIESLVSDGGFFEGPAEVHGMMTGVLCTNLAFPFARWLSEIDFQIGSAAGRAELEGLYDETIELIAAGQNEFELLLPADDVVLGERALALSHWVQGYLYGLGYRSDEQSWPGGIQSILLDLSGIAQLDPDVDGDEEEEQAFVEVVEFVRTAVMLIQAELQEQTDQMPQSQTPLH